MGDVLAFLAALGCHPAAPVVVRPDLPMFAYFDAGTVYVRDAGDPAVLVHELWHACQYEAHGPAADAAERERREREARRVELIYRERDR